jgi:hypothetical protein
MRRLATLHKITGYASRRWENSSIARTGNDTASCTLMWMHLRLIDACLAVCYHKHILLCAPSETGRTNLARTASNRGFCLLSCNNIC